MVVITYPYPCAREVALDDVGKTYQYEATTKPCKSKLDYSSNNENI